MNDKIDIGIAEDEDLVRAKAWWKENGSSIIGGVLIGTAMVVGYNFWQRYQDNHATEVAGLYEQFNQNAQDEAALEGLLGADNNAAYSQLARMTAAKIASDAGEYEQAEGLLKGILESKTDEGLRSVAVLRLASVYLANEKPDAALALLGAHANSGLPLMQARIQVLQGDIHAQQGETEKAKVSYEASILAMQEMGQAFELIQLKLDNL